jgi:hypothetical protein
MIGIYVYGSVLSTASGTCWGALGMYPLQIKEDFYSGKLLVFHFGVESFYFS